MFVATFYSFKGGVGRSMALMNVAVQLVLRGKRVLVVDFDLEAPGLPTFRVSSPQHPTKGIVEFIHEYLDTNATPDVQDFVYECRALGERGGQLFVMPAGVQDSSYPKRLAAIDWNDLYAQRDGYLLFEDLKLQWEESLRPDYVLIDSRTGHSDVVGICTRQLPNTAVLLFFPNEQNLRGIQAVASQIGEQNEGGGFPPIKVFLVPSNVPLEDDENSSLQTMLDRCKDTLGFTEFPATIHHYESPALLHQEVFSLTKDRHPLVQEYRTLTGRIVERNWNDRDVVLDDLKAFFQAIVADDSHEDDRNRIWEDCASIVANWSDDPEVCFWLARVQRALGDVEESLETLERSVRLGYRTLASLFDRAVVLNALGRKQDALLAIKEIFEERSVTMAPVDAMRVIRLAIRVDAAVALELTSSEKIRSLSVKDVIRMALELDASDDSAPITEAMLKNSLSHLPEDTVGEDRETLIHCLSLSLIAQGKLDEAVMYLVTQAAGDENSIAIMFNLAFALYWTGRREDAKKWADKVVSQAERSDKRNDANFYQCIALAYWMVGDIDKVSAPLQEARRLAREDPKRIFSAWGFTRVTLARFLNDLSEMEKLFKGSHVQPRFLEQMGRRDI